jgi:hypothetical protein
VNAYLRCVDAQEARAGMEGIDGLSIATYIWRLEMMDIISEERMEFCAQAEEMPGEIFAASPITLHIPMQERTQ